MNKRTVRLQQITSSAFIWTTDMPLIHHCQSPPTQDFSWLAEKGDRFLIKASLLKRHKVCSWAKTDQPFFFMKPYEQLSLLIQLSWVYKSQKQETFTRNKTLQYVLKYFRNPGVVFIESLDISDTHLPQHFHLSVYVAEPMLLRSWIWWSPLVTDDVFHHTVPAVPSFQWLSCNSF